MAWKDVMFILFSSSIGQRRQINLKRFNPMFVHLGSNSGVKSEKDSIRGCGKTKIVVVLHNLVRDKMGGRT